MESYQFRTAEPKDAEAAVPLIYSSGMQAIDYGFSHSKMNCGAFLHFAFRHGKGFLGHKNHTVALSHGRVVGIAAFYNLSNYAKLSVEHLWQLWRFYPASAFTELANRCIHLKSIMPPPGRKAQYVANFGVREEFRGIGIGTSLLDYQQAISLKTGITRFRLDVSVDNPRAQALYKRYGFLAHAENNFTGPPGVSKILYE